MPRVYAGCLQALRVLGRETKNDCKSPKLQRNRGIKETALSNYFTGQRIPNSYVMIQITLAMMPRFRLPGPPNRDDSEKFAKAMLATMKKAGLSQKTLDWIETWLATDIFHIYEAKWNEVMPPFPDTRYRFNSPLYDPPNERTASHRRLAKRIDGLRKQFELLDFNAKATGTEIKTVREKTYLMWDGTLSRHKSAQQSGERLSQEKLVALIRKSKPKIYISTGSIYKIEKGQITPKLYPVVVEICKRLNIQLKHSSL